MIMRFITALRDLRAALELAGRVRKLERAIDAVAHAIDRLDERNADLRARQDEFAKV